MKLRTLLVGAVAGLLLTACGGGSTPQDVTKSFVQALADGECPKAQEMTVDAATDLVKSQIDAGCEKYTTEIKSVDCEETGETASCKCVEARDNGMGGDITYKYSLKKVDGAWKISNYEKDFDMDMGAGM